ncbi:12-oxophytodienoate reductase 2-like [Pyrus ussuriensis x Pyrus communis]|uniref:12-oxophytodienoate reductase 2-like n=1 Tax=Pyrus ussuriensis x Pyrus communis TaxID=2448454 RepID=A0A5N5F7F5_9ROSA|nr:12-oxophytodienoate reductase 2-like [Pyrus ussuriensis x Pyrus communis]
MLQPLIQACRSPPSSADALTKTCHSVEAFIEDQLVSFRCSHCMAFLILRAKAVLEALFVIYGLI